MTVFYKEVLFSQYCGSCRYEKLKESEDPCELCLATFARVGTHRPIFWEKKREVDRRGKRNEKEIE